MPDHRDAVTVIGPEASFKGEIAFAGTLRILGNFEGKISAEGDVTIEHGASCRAAVEAATITIDGHHEGNLVAAQRLQLNSHANVRGDIVAPALAMAEGAVYVGHCTVGADALQGSREGRAGSMVESKLTRSKLKNQDWLADAEPVTAGPRSSWLHDPKGAD